MPKNEVPRVTYTNPEIASVGVTRDSNLFNPNKMIEISWDAGLNDRAITDDAKDDTLVSLVFVFLKKENENICFLDSILVIVMLKIICFNSISTPSIHTYIHTYIA